MSSILTWQLSVHCFMLNAMDTIGKRIKYARNEQGISQTRLGELCNGLSRSAIAQWEANDTTPTGPNLVDTARILQVSTEWLVYGDEAPENDAVGGPSAARPQAGPTDEDLLKLAMAAALSFVDVNDLSVEPARAAELILEIYRDAKENLADGTHENPIVATAASAKAILRTLK
jgi:transcriptional regulator with XRE-family HTH domain